MWAFGARIELLIVALSEKKHHSPDMYMCFACTVWTLPLLQLSIQDLSIPIEKTECRSRLRIHTQMPSRVRSGQVNHWRNHRHRRRPKKRHLRLHWFCIVFVPILWNCRLMLIQVMMENIRKPSRPQRLPASGPLNVCIYKVTDRAGDVWSNFEGTTASLWQVR